MNNIVVVEVADSVERLAEESVSLRLGEDCLGVLMIEQVAALCILHYHVDFTIF